MNSIEQTAVSILDISKKIFKINEENSPQTIFKGKTFLIAGEDVTVERNDCKDSFYYFECPEIDGVIIKKENGDYCIKATVQYINSEGRKWSFAKIRIYDYHNEIRISGRRTGSLEMPDYEDVDFIKEPDSELSLVVNSMNSSLYNIYNKLNENIVLNGDKYISRHVKRLVKYNI